MKENDRTKCSKKSFIDETFGEKIEYVKIFDKKGMTIIFGTDERLIVKNFKNVGEMIEAYISMYNENQFINKMLDDLDNKIIVKKSK